MKRDIWSAVYRKWISSLEPSYICSKYLHKTSVRENEAVVTPKGFMTVSGIHRYLIPVIQPTWTTLQATSVNNLTKTKSHLLCQCGISLCCSYFKNNMEKHPSHSRGKKREVQLHLFALRRHGEAVISNRILNKCVGVCVRRRKDKRTYT